MTNKTNASFLAEISTLTKLDAVDTFEITALGNLILVYTNRNKISAFYRYEVVGTSLFRFFSSDLTRIQCREYVRMLSEVPGATPALIAKVLDISEARVRQMMERIDG